MKKLCTLVPLALLFAVRAEVLRPRPPLPELKQEVKPSGLKPGELD